jgi:hypothetical protein
MVCLVLAGHQACELGKHPGRSRTGDRRRGCRTVGRGGRERYAAYLPWLPRCVCAGASAKYGPCQRCPGQRRDLPEESRGRPGYSRRPGIGRGEVIPCRYAALGLRGVPGPIAVFASGAAVALTLAFDEVALAKAIEVGFALPIAFGVTIAFGVALVVTVTYGLALVIPVADGLSPVSR